MAAWPATARLFSNDTRMPKPQRRRGIIFVSLLPCAVLPKASRDCGDWNAKNLGALRLVFTHISPSWTRGPLKSEARKPKAERNPMPETRIGHSAHFPTVSSQKDVGHAQPLGPWLAFAACSASEVD